MIHIPTMSGNTARIADPALAARVSSFITAPSEDDFDELALAVHDYQYRHNPVYRRFADRMGGRSPRTWKQIPAVPAVAFKEAALCCGRAERVYESSGTTEGPYRKARHHVPDVALYRASALAGFHASVLAAGERRSFVVAAPERTTHPTSSLGEMVSWIRSEHDSGSRRNFLIGRDLDDVGFSDALDALEPVRPALILGVTSALLRLGDYARASGRRWRLPVGSLVVDTGGCKGYGADLPRSEVLDRYQAVFGVENEHVVNEYGMTEMCSQLYGRGLEPMRVPPWVRVVVCDPATGREQSSGEPGLLRFLDLANLGSVSAIHTEDVGRAVDGGLELLGRAPQAEARGCSLVLHASP